MRTGGSFRVAATTNTDLPFSSIEGSALLVKDPVGDSAILLSQVYDADGRELPGSGGYKYFGAARDLPGVKELFQSVEPEAPRRSRADMYKGIDPDYYGYR
jgi:hypothetical protein